jgi:hypothetical protein
LQGFLTNQNFGEEEEERQFILFAFIYCAQQVANERMYRNHGNRNQSNIDLLRETHSVVVVAFLRAP